ncbi:MAG: D-alanyl-D-alanine carboxypeptidase [Oscillospiraceae bacterium]|nr:D-alanyl-D-alanine carboxypeptidase [Oscillospiraceae bacterium]
MKKNRALCLIFAILMLLLSVPGPAQAEPIYSDQSVSSGCHSVDAAMQLTDGSKLTDTAKAAIVYERKSDTMIYAWNPDQQIYPTSTAKMMTALIAIEKGDPAKKVIVSKRALDELPIGTITAKLQAGEELTLEQLLYCLMTASANDAALVIAEHIAGSQSAFVDMMNQKAAELGCKDTVYTNPHGLHDPNMHTTARDICRLTDAALENELFRTLFCAKSHEIPATNKSDARTVTTSNLMMRQPAHKKYHDPRVTGGKTGSTDAGGRCLVATAEGNGMELLTIVMDATPTYEIPGISLATYGSFEETAQLLNHVIDNYEYRQLFYEGQVITQYPVAGGENSAVVQPVQPGGTVLPVNLDKNQLSWVYGNTAMLTAPVEKGQAISTLQVWYGSKCLAQTDLVAINSVAVWQEPVQHPRAEVKPELGLWGIAGIILFAILALAVIAVATVLILRFVRKAKRNARRRSRRVNRRRSR